MPQPRQLAIYGNASMPRVYCDACEMWALVRNDRKLCCDEPAREPPQVYVRMSQPEMKRGWLPLRIRKAILAEQGHRCLYCERTFGPRVKLQWDHMVPWSHTMNNDRHNIAAACRECNQCKSNLIFQTVDEVRTYVASHRKAPKARMFDVRKTLQPVS